MTDTVRKKVLQILADILSSPNFVWFFSMYLSSLMMMISFNISRVGFSWETIITAPRYYAEVFLTYGLNYNSSYESPLYGPISWILVPFLVVFMGFSLYYIKDAGLAYNGVVSDRQGTLYYAFFREEVYGYDTHFWGTKANLFFLSLIWIPIIVAILSTIGVRKRYKRKVSNVLRFMISLGISMILGIELAKMSDPNLSFAWDGFFESIFVDRSYNYFVIYEGYYPPITMAFLFALFQILPILYLELVEFASFALISIRRNWGKKPLMKLFSTGDATLPWEEK